MERNAWKVAQDVVSRIDGEPGPAGDCMKAYVSDTKEQQFFFNTEYLQKYSAAKSEVRKAKVPGHNYFKKLDETTTSCMIAGEMFHEYFQNKSVIPTPRPVPDTNKLPKYHYLPVEETPVTNINSNTMREVDDFHPRACLKQAYRNKEISIEDCASIQTFCNKYIVEENLVKTYLEHPNHLEMMSEKRKTEKKKKNLKENAMSYEEFDWNEMLNDGTLAKQRVPILDKYIEKHNLLAVKSGKKSQKVNAIIDHLQSNKRKRIDEEEYDFEYEYDSEDEYEETLPTCFSDEDMVLGEIGESSDQMSDSESDY